MSQAVLELEVELRTSDLRGLERFLDSLKTENIIIDPSCDYSHIRDGQRGFKTTLRFQPYVNGVSVKDDIVCKVMHEKLCAFVECGDVLSYGLRRSGEGVVFYAKI